MAKEPFKNPDWPLHCVVCGKVVTRPQVIDAIRKDNREKSAFGRETIFVKCQTCDTELGVTMEKADLISVEINPKGRPCWTRCPHAEAMVRVKKKEAQNEVG